jgi:hypothetical protein
MLFVLIDNILDIFKKPLETNNYISQLLEILHILYELLNEGAE